nr:MAG TPA: hypothetical protein [Caudoviricetes sp.]
MLQLISSDFGHCFFILNKQKNRKQMPAVCVLYF